MCALCSIIPSVKTWSFRGDMYCYLLCCVRTVTCYSAANTKQFCDKITAWHVTSSPLFAQSNDKAEAAVKICKKLLQKNNANLQFAVFTHKSSPMSSGFSPAQLFLGRRHNTNLPTKPSMLKPAWPNLVKHRSKAQKRHRAQLLPTLVPGDHVFIKQGKNTIKGKVVKRDRRQRSYRVQTQNGVVRRNRRWSRVNRGVPSPRLEKCLKMHLMIWCHVYTVLIVVFYRSVLFYYCNIHCRIMQLGEHYVNVFSNFLNFKQRRVLHYMWKRPIFARYLIV